MKVLFIFIILFPTFVFAETYFCIYEELYQVKKLNLNRVTHSHFKRCMQDKCSEYKYSVIFANNDSLIIGDIEENEKSFFLFIIDKKTNNFSATKINFPAYEKEKTFFNGKCVKK